MDIPFAETQFGFQWGGGEIKRVCDIEKTGAVILALETKRTELEIYVTRTGKVRVVTHGGNEWHEEA